MAATTPIEWTDKTWNPIVGCSIVSPGCTNCYAMTMAARIEKMAAGKTHYAGTTQPSKAGPVWTGKVALAPEHVLLQPLRWKKPSRIFVNSMGDLFHDDVPDEWIDKVFAIMALAPQHTFQVLTKRAERMLRYVGAASCLPRRQRDIRAAITMFAGGRDAPGVTDAFVRVSGARETCRWRPLPNLWLGVSAEDQARANERIPHLLATPAAIRFVSVEPLLGPLTIFDMDGPIDVPDGMPSPLHWVICGGESGAKARPAHPDWFRSLRDQCAAAGVPFLLKQWGEWHPSAMHDPADCGRHSGIALHVSGRAEYRPAEALGLSHCEGWVHLCRVGKKAAGNTLDGHQHLAFPPSPLLPGGEKAGMRGRSK